jgi:hypothetical protein
MAPITKLLDESPDGRFLNQKGKFVFMAWCQIAFQKICAYVNTLQP